jgi:NAD(P)H-hydrate epimerase
VLSRDQIRSVDKMAVEHLGMLSLVLMENAARGLCDVIRTTGPWPAITIIAGPGNNGGDGLATARLLAAEQPDASSVRVLLIRGGKSLSNDTDANLRILHRCGIAVEEPSPESATQLIARLPAGSLLVDSLLGTGVRGHLAEPFLSLITAMNRSPATKLAVDVPSGMDCNSGEACGAVIYAQHTVTFVAAKPGFLTARGRQSCGQLHVKHIGVPAAWIAQLVTSPAQHQP